jgi:hypothetical protein
MALRHEPGVVGDLAKKAFHEVMNPKVFSEKTPDPKPDNGKVKMMP